MTSNTHYDRRLFSLVMLHGTFVLTVGLIAGVILIFSLLDAVHLWPLPAWNVQIPGTTRGWQAAHVGGILNGVMLMVLILAATKLHLPAKQFKLSCWSLVVVGWGNTLFYWAGCVAPNRGLSMADTHFGPADVAGMLAFVGGGVAMVALFAVMYFFAVAAMRQMNHQ